MKSKIHKLKNIIAKAVCNKKNVISLILCALMMGFAKPASAQKIEFSAAQLYPEGIACDAKTERIFLSSLYLGKVSVVDAKGTYSVFCDDAKLITTIGMKFNPLNNKLYVLNGDAGMSKRSSPETLKKINQLVIINGKTGVIENTIELGGLFEGKHFANDLTLDKEGNVYITDSYSPVIYKIDTKNKASVFAKNDAFKPDSTAIGLNGIDWNPEGYLLVVKTVEGTLWKVTMDGKVTQVKLNGDVKRGDGILFTKPNELAVVQNSLSKTAFLQTNDHWATANLLKDVKATGAFPTTATQDAKNVYIINSRLSELREVKKDDPKFIIDVIAK
ncbi:MAG: hypothetical protein ACYDCN_09635 [Bacteroidia bacterium]